MPVHLPTFLVTAWLLAMLPGAGQALMLRQTLTRGRRAAWLSVFGTCVGLLIWSTLAAAGLSAVLLTNDVAYLVLRIAGGLVLVVLGLNTWWTLWRHRNLDVPPTPNERSAFLAGLVTNLSNPKAGVFAISLIPQFIDPQGYAFLSAVFLGVLWALVVAAWYAIFIWVAERGRRVVTKPSVAIGLQVVTGLVLIVLGVTVVVAA